MRRFKRILRPIVRRTLSPAMIQGLRFRYWCISSYFPRLLTSRVIRPVPEIHQFGAAHGEPCIAKQLQKVSVMAPTEMCRVMTKLGSDKGIHQYTPLYSALFKQRCDQPLRIFELGLGTNNVNMLSNMGEFGRPGASLRGWRQLFPNAHVYGADIDRGILFEEDRIKTFYCDQLDPSSIRELWSHPDLRDGVDIIIEDALHTFEANILFLKESLQYLRPGGVYITEDIYWDSLELWHNRLETIYSKQYPEYEFVLVIMASQAYNNLLFVRRKEALSDSSAVGSGAARVNK